MSTKLDDRQNDGAVRVDLERGRNYKITAAGEAFMSEHTGANADPFLGVARPDQPDRAALTDNPLTPFGGADHRR